MAVVGAYALGATGQVLSGKLLRLSLGAALRPAAAGVQVISGVLTGPPNTMGELTLQSNAQLTVQPYRAVIQNTQDATAGAYVVPNDAAAVLGAAQGFPAQDATQFRRALIVTYVDDAQVAGSGANQAYLTILPGALAASAVAAALPALPANALSHGELLIPPTGQSVTLTPYNPRTGLRHGIQSGIIADGSTIAGHDAAAGVFDGQYRDHPTLGLQRWNATRAAWEASGPTPDILTVAYGGGFADYVGSFQALRVFRTGRQARAAGLAAPPAGNNGSLTAGTTYTVATIPAAALPVAAESAIGPLWTGTAWNLAVVQALTGGQLNAIPLVTTGAGWNISFGGLQWRVA